MENNQEIVNIPSQEVEAIDATEYMLSMAKRRSTLLDTVKEFALKATNNQDWVDQNGTPYLTGSGAEKVIRRFALKVWEPVSEKFKESDANGEYYYFRVMGKVGFNESEFIVAMGTCSSRDQFFAKRNDVLMPVEEIDITNIQKAAYTNFLVNGATRFLGIRNLEWTEVEKYGIKKSAVAKIEYKKDTKSSGWTDEQSDHAIRFGNYLLAIHNNTKPAAEQELELLTTFEVKEGDKTKTVKGKRSIKQLTGKQIDVLWNKFKSKVETFEQSGSPQKEVAKGGKTNGNSKDNSGQGNLIEEGKG